MTQSGLGECSWPPRRLPISQASPAVALLVERVAGWRGFLNVGLRAERVRLATVLQAPHPHLRGVVYDLPWVVDGAAPVLDEAGVGDRASTVGGDFFASVPPGGDVHLLANIIHDWDDERAVRILTNCRAALEPGGRVLLGEA